MEKIDRVKFWIKGSDEAYKMAKFLFENKKYADSLFYGQLCLEKLLKAIYIQRKSDSPPFVHSLGYLAGRAEIEIDKEINEDLKEISNFNINARYDDYKNSFFMKATKEFSIKYLDKIGKIRTWLKSQLEK